MLRLANGVYVENKLGPGPQRRFNMYTTERVCNHEIVAGELARTERDVAKLQSVLNVCDIAELMAYCSVRGLNDQTRAEALAFMTKEENSDAFEAKILDKRGDTKSTNGDNRIFMMTGVMPSLIGNIVKMRPSKKLKGWFEVVGAVGNYQWHSTWFKRVKPKK